MRALFPGAVASLILALTFGPIPGLSAQQAAGPPAISATAEPHAAGLAVSPLVGTGPEAPVAGKGAGPAGNAEPLPVPSHPATDSARTLADLEQLALKSNPTLVQAAARVAMSKAKALQAGLCPNPTVGYVGEQIGGAGTAGERQGAFIQQEIVTGG